jgi:membrane protein required for colicin V production
VTGVDWAILAVLLISIVQAASEGFFHEAFGIAGLVIGYVLAAWQYEQVAAWFAPHVKSQWFAEIAGFLVIFIGVMILAGIAGRIARWLMQAAGLSFFDRALGSLLGLLRGSLLVSVLLVSMAAFTPTSGLFEGSSLAPYFLVVGRAAVWAAPSDLRARFYQGLNLLHHPEQPVTATAGR